MSALSSEELKIVKSKIAKTEAKLEMAEQAKDRDLVLANTNLLTSLYQEKQRLENSGNVSIWKQSFYILVVYICGI